MELQVLETIVLVIHVLAALAIIGLVLIQQGKGAEVSHDSPKLDPPSIYPQSPNSASPVDRGFTDS